MNSNEISELLSGASAVPFSAKPRSVEAGIECIIHQPPKSVFPDWIALTTATEKTSAYGRTAEPPVNAAARNTGARYNGGKRSS